MSKERIIDIEELKRKHKHQLENALLANDLNSKYDYIDITVYDCSHYINNKYTYIGISKGFKSLDLNTAKRVLQEFPCDEEFTYDNYTSKYNIIIHNEENCISFVYISNKKVIYLSLQLFDFKPFIKKVYRSDDVFEDSYNEFEKAGFSYPCYIFNNNHKYALGSDYLRDNKLTEEIINYIFNYK